MDDLNGSQDEVLAFLGDAANLGGGTVKRIDTHAAAVFLCGNRALKIKRAVRFPFLDFSTLDRRRAALEAELRVNRAFTPQIYRGVLPIVRGAGGKLALGGDGEVVEWALEMRRFDEAQTLDRLADAGRIDTAMATRLADAVVAMHKRAARADAGAWLAAVADFIDQNREAFGAAPALFPPDAVERLDRAARRALARLRPLLAARGERGLIRRGHGDLHLGNIAMLDGELMPFDALEFDPVIASGDVLYDLAFLLMDLVERDLRGPANNVLNDYLTRTHRADDLDGLAALPLFLSLRAAIRAKVTAARPAPNGAERAAIDRAARAYFDLAARMIEPPPPRLIAVGGLSGTGKSVLARGLAPSVAPDPGAVVLRSDVERKLMFGVAPTAALPEDAYRLEVTDKVYAALADKAGRVIAAGHSAIVDAVFARELERSAIAAVAAARGVGFSGLFLTVDLETRIARVGGRTGDASDANAAVARQQEGYALGAIEWPTVDAAGTPQDTLRRAGAALGLAQT